MPTEPPTAAQPGFDEYLLIERARSIGEQRFVSLISEIGVCVLTAGVLWYYQPHAGLLIWLCLAVPVAFLSWYCHQNVHPGDPGLAGRYWLARSAFCFFLSGLFWGLVPLFFFSPDNSVFLVWIYAGYVAGVLCVSTAYAPAFMLFALGISAPYAARLLWEDGNQYNLMAAQLVFYVLMLGYVSFNMQQLFLRSVKSQFDNMSLLRQLAVEKETAEQAVQAKDQFLAAASHDLRQPLNAMSLFIDALSTQGPESSVNIVGKIRQSMRALNSMLHGLLSISQLNSSSLQNNPVHIRISNVITAIQDEYTDLASRKNIRFTNNVDRDAVVRADKVLLDRLIRNLVDNAIKYTVQGSVEVTGRDAGDTFVLSISDSGIGIPQHQQLKIFDEFYQLNNPSRDRSKGLGLGLAIVQRISRLMECELRLESEPGRGSTFSITLPIGNADELVESKYSSNISLDGLTVLVIDDEQDILDGMQSILRGWNCKSVAVKDLTSAIHELTESGLIPDLIITDFRLENNASGLDAAEAVQEEFNLDIPVILITGETSPAQVKAAAQADALVLYKPIDSSELEQAIHALISEWQPALVS